MQKQEFLNKCIDSVGSRKSYIILFNSIEKFEKDFGVDICFMNSNELSIVINYVVGYRNNSRKVSISKITKYLNWCCENVPNSINSIKNINVDSRIGNILIKSPQHLNNILDNMFDPVCERTIDNIYRMYFWLAYSGISINDAFSVKKTDVDLDNLIIKFNNNIYKIYNEEIDVIKFCIESEVFVYKHPLYNDKIRLRESGDQLIIGYNYTKKTSLTPTISKRVKSSMESGKIKTDISYYRCLVSGLFYDMYIKEINGYDINYILDNKDYIELKRTNNSGIIVNYSYKKDYEEWKNMLNYDI